MLLVLFISFIVAGVYKFFSTDWLIFTRHIFIDFCEGIHAVVGAIFIFPNTWGDSDVILANTVTAAMLEV